MWQGEWNEIGWGGEGQQQTAPLSIRSAPSLIKEQTVNSQMSGERGRGGEWEAAGAAETETEAVTGNCNWDCNCNCNWDWVSGSGSDPNMQRLDGAESMLTEWVGWGEGRRVDTAATHRDRLNGHSCCALAAARHLCSLIHSCCCIVCLTLHTHLALRLAAAHCCCCFCVVETRLRSRCIG